MMSNKRLCAECDIPMERKHIMHKGLKFEVLQCPHCKENLFTEQLAMKAIAQLEAKRLHQEYVKHPIKIGHSWGITFPKEVADVFQLNQNKKLKVRPDVQKKRIEIVIG